MDRNMSKEAKENKPDAFTADPMIAYFLFTPISDEEQLVVKQNTQPLAFPPTSSTVWFLRKMGSVPQHFAVTEKLTIGVW